MEIKGDTIFFKSEYEPFMYEWHGEKPNTVRKIPANELMDFLRWMDGEAGEDLKICIELANSKAYKPEALPPSGPTFQRDVTNVYEIGRVLGEPIFVISWRHPE
jgi:hypothetical protein